MTRDSQRTGRTRPMRAVLLLLLTLMLLFQPTRDWLLTVAQYVLAVAAGVVLTVLVLCGGNRSRR